MNIDFVNITPECEMFVFEGGAITKAAVFAGRQPAQTRAPGCDFDTRLSGIV